MTAPTGTKHRTITRILLEAGVVTEIQIEAGLLKQRETGRRIGESLVELGYVSEEDIGWALARQLGIPFVDVRAEALDAELLREFPEGALRRLQAVPLVREEGSITAAVADPTDREGMHELELLFDAPTTFVAATSTAIERALDTVLGRRTAAARPRNPEPAEGPRAPVVWERSGESFLNFHLLQARRLGTSEIHFVVAEGRLQVLHRKATRLVPVAQEPESAMDLLLTRLDALGARITPVREDHARFSTTCEFGGVAQPIHVSLLSGRDRQSVTVRLLRDPDDRPRLETLGLDMLDIAEIRHAVREPSGLILVCGPTGSGCSTTLSALLVELPTQERRWAVFARDQRRWPSVPGLVDVITGPLVRRWRGIAVAHAVDGLVLDGGLEGRRVRASLDAATHGRWVLARSDWEDTFALIEYLMKAPGGRSSLARRLRAVIQQRLVATPHAGEAPTEGLSFDAAGRPQADTLSHSIPAVPLYRAVFEVLLATDAFRSAMLAGAAANELRMLAERQGFRPLAVHLKAGVEAGRLDPRDAARALD